LKWSEDLQEMRAAHRVEVWIEKCSGGDEVLDDDRLKALTGHRGYLLDAYQRYNDA